MTDRPQPKLTLDEELDVLEAVYKIGKEKGLELLRPEQVKKLRDGGRISLILDESPEEKLQARPLPAIGKGALTVPQAKFLVMGLRTKLMLELKQMMFESGGWDVFSSEQRDYALNCYFQYVYGLSQESLVDDLVNGREVDGY